MNYDEIAGKILPLIGGNINISAFHNCMTRLRINVKDQSLVKYEELKNIKGIIGIVKGEQIQIVIGPGHAQRLRDSFDKALKDSNNKNINISIQKDMREKVQAAQQRPLQKALKHIGNIFIPLIPGFVGTGLIAGIASILAFLIPSVTLSPWYFLLIATGNLLTNILNILTGYNAGKEFGGTPVLGAIAGALVYSPALSGIITGNGAENISLVLPFFNLSLSPGLGGIVSVLAAAFIFAKTEKIFRSFIPAMFDLFLIPALTIFAGGIITLFIIMPLAAVFVKGINFILIDIILMKGGIIGGFILSASFLPLVMLGIHHGLTPIHIELISSRGYTVLFPVLAMAGAGQVGAALAVYVKTKNRKIKKLIASSLPAGFLGAGEPLIYGVSLPLFTPFVTACLGAGFGGALIAFASNNINNVGAFQIGVSGLALIPLISNNMWFWYLAGLITSYICGFLLTFFFGVNEKRINEVYED